MNSLPYEIKLTYFISLAIAFIFVAFIIFIILLYNRKQILFQKERQLKEAEHQNQILQAQLEKQQILEEERQRISRDMHDDLGAGISALKLNAEFMKQKMADNNELMSDVVEMLKTTEEMNLSMREMLWSLDKEKDNIDGFIKYVGTYTENFFRNHILRIIIDNETTENFELSAEIRRNLFLCVKEALNNVYKHSQANELTLHFSQNKTYFQVVVLDNGIGLQHGRKGNGLNNMENRLKKIGGMCTIKNLNPGLKISFSVPLILS